MNWRAVFAIARKDLKVVWQNKGVSIPIIILPLILFVVLPLMLGLAPALFSIPSDSFAEVQQMLDTMPPALRASLVGLSMMQQTVVLFLVYIMAPLYLIVPMMVSSVVAADSFAGEKERKTLEALLYTPTSDRELLIAKMLGAWLPAVAVAWLGFALYAVVVNLAGWPTMGRVFFPNAMWLVLAIWVAPAVAGLGLASMVLVSVRAQGFQDAYQLGTLAILPIVILMIAQATGVIYFSVTLVLLLGLVLWIIDAVLIVFGNRTFPSGVSSIAAECRLIPILNSFRIVILNHIPRPLPPTNREPLHCDQHPSIGAGHVQRITAQIAGHQLAADRLVHAVVDLVCPEADRQGMAGLKAAHAFFRAKRARPGPKCATMKRTEKPAGPHNVQPGRIRRVRRQCKDLAHL